MEAEIILPEVAVQSRGEQPRHKTTALIDTGASSTVISDHIAGLLELVPIRRVSRLCASGLYEANEYVVDVAFPGSPIYVPRIRVTDANLKDQPYGMLIGRDILAHARLLYHGKSGLFSLDIPCSDLRMSELPEKVADKIRKSKGMNRADRRKATKKERLKK